MGALFYHVTKAVLRVPRLACICERVYGAARVERAGPVLLACSHLSHLEPMFVSAVVRRQVRWMSRVEFYRPRLAGAILNWGGAFPVDRYGNALPAVRTAVRLLRDGAVVGMFPEGGLAQGRESVLRGAEIKQGVCTISIETGVPVVPVVVLGTEKLNEVRPWLPTKSGRVWMAFGEDVLPPRRGGGKSRRELREEMAGWLRGAFVRTYQGLLHESGVRDEDVP